MKTKVKLYNRQGSHNLSPLSNKKASFKCGSKDKRVNV